MMQRLSSSMRQIDNTETKHNPEKANNAKLNYPGLVAFYDTRPGND